MKNFPLKDSNSRRLSAHRLARKSDSAHETNPWIRTIMEDFNDNLLTSSQVMRKKFEMTRIYFPDIFSFLVRISSKISPL